MSELARLQRAFAGALTSTTAAPPAAALFQGKSADTLERLALYRGNMVAAARNALMATYPVIVKIVGTEFFEGLVREYLRLHPPFSGDLNDYGEALSRFVGEFPHTQDLPYLPDVARMEWQVHRAHYAKDAPSNDIRQLAAIPEIAWGELQIVLAPSCALLTSPWPLAKIWQVHQDDYHGEFVLDLEGGPECMLIFRPCYRVQVAPISRGAYRFLQDAKSGAPIATALEAALAEESEFDLTVALPVWVKAAVIVGIEHHAAG